MPTLDRRITVRRTVSDFNQYGEAETIVTDWPSWATRLDASLLDAAQAGGSLDTASRTYIVRWRREIAEAQASQIFVLEGDATLKATNIIEQARVRDERRRFLRIEVVGEVTS